jgi:hypothetical protein
MALHLRGGDGAGGDDVTTARLYSELVESGLVDADRPREHQPQSVLETVTDELFDGEPFAFEESIVKNELDEIILLLVAMRERNIHGKGLMREIESVFDTELSPGTVYPRLHDLDDAGLLRARDLVQTTEYHVEDDDAARSQVDAAMRQHLALGYLCSVALDEL